MKTRLPDFLKSKRKAAGLSQGDVAHHLGYSTPQFISNWERGLSSPPLEVLGDLIDLYGINSKEIVRIILEDTKTKVESSIKKKKKKKKKSRSA